MPQQRLLTIVGPGGIGKTSVALAVADRLLAAHTDGVWLVDLLPLSDPRLVPSALAAVLGLEIRSDNPLPCPVVSLGDTRFAWRLKSSGRPFPGCSSQRLCSNLCRSIVGWSRWSQGSLVNRKQSDLGKTLFGSRPRKPNTMFSTSTVENPWSPIWRDGPRSI